LLYRRGDVTSKLSSRMKVQTARASAMHHKCELNVPLSPKQEHTRYM
jgi:hypothetical protein